MNHQDYNAHNTLSAMRARRLTTNDEWIPHMRLQLDAAHAVKRAQRLRKAALAVLAMLVALAVLGALHESMNDEIQTQSLYCRMVHDGNWPDYRHVYRQACLANGSVNVEYVRGN